MPRTRIPNAASMAFRHDSHGEPFRTNVDGMRNMLALCQQAGIETFHHVSTAYICGLRSGRVREDEVDLGQENGNVYEVSKLGAEKLLRSAGFLRQTTVYRPASVVGDSLTGYTTSTHGFYLPLQLAYVMADKVPTDLMGDRFFRLLGLRGDEGKNLVTVDWLSAAGSSPISAAVRAAPTWANQSSRLTSGSCAGDFTSGRALELGSAAAAAEAPLAGASVAGIGGGAEVRIRISLPAGLSRAGARREVPVPSSAGGTPDGR